MRKRIQRRRAEAIRKGRAVSPVVATLILILVAVAAAAALYLWLVAWQGNVTSGIGNQSAQATVQIGGSSSVYPFDQVAVAQFQQNHSDVVISNNQGGTGAGMLAVCHGAVDIGASSSLQTVAGLETNDQCPSTTVINTVAYDAVDMIVASANPHQLQSISFDTVALIYEGTSTTPTLLASTDNGVTTTSGILNVAPWSTHAALAWDQIAACVNGAATCGGVTTAGVLPVALGTGIGAGVACTGNANLICANAGVSPCGFTICAGGSVASPGTNLIKTVARSDASGTTQTFESRILGATSASAFAGSTAGLGFSGCGSNNLIADCGYAATTTGNGNPGVITAVGASPDAIGYVSDGLARATGSGVAILSFNGVGQVACATAGQCANGAVTPTLSATGTISAGIQSSTTVANYVGWRPFEWVTTNTPTGEVQVLLTYVLDPANNIAFAAESQTISVYSV